VLLKRITTFIGRKLDWRRRERESSDRYILFCGRGGVYISDKTKYGTRNYIKYNTTTISIINPPRHLHLLNIGGNRRYRYEYNYMVLRRYDSESFAELSARPPPPRRLLQWTSAAARDRYLYNIPFVATPSRSETGVYYYYISTTNERLKCNKICKYYSW